MDGLLNLFTQADPSFMMVYQAIMRYLAPLLAGFLLFLCIKPMLTFRREPEIWGWLRIEGTRLNYPVMQTPNEPNYYLYRDFYKNSNKNGCLYAREDCDINGPSDNITIYGHHSKATGVMFNTLNGYTQKSFWEAHPYIQFDTLTEHHTYEIVAVFKTSANLGEGFAYHEFVNAASEEEFNKFVKTCKELSFYDTGVTAQYGDKLITLSTCEYTLNNGRLAVVAKRIEG